MSEEEVSQSDQKQPEDSTEETSSEDQEQQTESQDQQDQAPAQESESGEIGDHLSDDELSSLMNELLNDPESGVQSADIPNFEDVSTTGASSVEPDIDTLMDVNLTVRVELGRTYMYIDDILHLKEGSVVQLDKLAGDPVDILVNNRLIARGEVLVLNDNFCVRMTEIIDPEELLE